MTSIADLYEQRAAEDTDIKAHMSTLHALASECDHVTEFGMRWCSSSIALLAGLPRRGVLVSYDINPDCQRPAATHGSKRWEFIVADTAQLDLIDDTDLLFIDTLHDAAQVTAELRQAKWVHRWLVFHDTVLFGTADESTGQPPGIMHAILTFMGDHPEWQVRSHSYESCGLLVLERQWDASSRTAR